MDPFGSNRAASSNLNIIAHVTEHCNCDKMKATDLLSKSDNDPEKTIKLHNIISQYREKLSPRPLINTSIKPHSDSDLPYALNEFHDTEHSSRPSPDNRSWRPSSRSSGGSVHESRSNSPQYLHHSPLLSPSSHNGYHDAAASSTEAFNGQFVDINLNRSNPAKRFDSEPENAKSNVLNENPSNTDNSELEWNFVLPVIPLPVFNLGPNLTGDYETFNLRDLVGHMQNGASLQLIQNYLERFDRIRVKEHINDDIDGFPAMFYVVETNKEDMVRTWVSCGGDPTVVHKQSKIPLLAFAIMHSENIQADTTLTTATLLSLGASPDVIPKAFYSPYLQDLPETGPSEDTLKDLDDQKRWCTGAARMKMARATTLSQRYYLERAAKTKKPSVRQIQVAQKRHAEPLLGIANFLIGQTMAAKALLNKLLSHLIVPSKKPLVLVFAGPSGHGKTELARRLGTLLSLPLEVVDCTIFNCEMELFGPRRPYVGWDKGSRLNNFLAGNYGKRCIVFLDEFEKTNSDIHKTLLLPFDNGEYQDRRSGDKINCSHTIWILATNAHDPIIQDFSDANSRILFVDDNESEKERLLKQLSKKIKQDFLAHHGSPITGRISEFVPFLPFSKGEQAVIVHKYLLELGRHIRKPVNLMEGDSEQLVGNVKLRIYKDASVCGILAQSEYHTDLGARSLINAVDTIKTSIVESYLKADNEIIEGGGMSEFILDVIGGEIESDFIPSDRR